jgi:hypothetical protein
MNSERERELELEIERELRGLPDLEAPATLAPRVLKAIVHRTAVRWYNQPWQYWPMPLRVTALALLSVMFGGLTIASWQLTRAAGMSAALQEVAGVFSGLTTVWNLVTVLLGSVVVVFKHLGTGFMIGCVVLAACGYAVCVGLGTAWWRLAFARR